MTAIGCGISLLFFFNSLILAIQFFCLSDCDFSIHCRRIIFILLRLLSLVRPDWNSGAASHEFVVPSARSAAVSAHRNARPTPNHGMEHYLMPAIGALQRN
jgi:hypothetical protein